MVRFSQATLVAVAAIVVAGGARPLHAQDLAPRAYVITPLRSNAVTLGYSYNDGELLLGGTVPVTGATGKLSVPSVTYYRSFGLFGRSANVLAALPYGVGTFAGQVFEEQRSIYRSGLLDSVFRLSVNLVGGPAMPLAAFRQWRQKTLLGAASRSSRPPASTTRPSSSTWAPTDGRSSPSSASRGPGPLGASTPMRRCGSSPRTPSSSRQPVSHTGTQSQKQNPIAAVEFHFSYDVRPRLWVSLDGNFWHGGKTSVNGVENPATLQKNSRVGITASLPLTRHQSLKVSFAQGAYIRFGGDYKIFSAGWQYSWIDHPK